MQILCGGILHTLIRKQISSKKNENPGLRCSKKRSLLDVNELFESERNAEVRLFRGYMSRKRDLNP